MKIRRIAAIFITIGALLLSWFACQNTRKNDGTQPKAAVSDESPKTAAASMPFDSFDEQTSLEAVSNSRRNAITNAVEMVSPAVVGISVKSIQEYAPTSLYELFFYGGSVQREVSGLGSGFIISEDGYIVTNDHVVGDAREIKVTMTNGETHDARLIETDFVSDVALLKIDGGNFPAVKLGDSDDIIIGEWVIALGNPFGLFEINDKPSVTVGVISAVDRDFGGQIAVDRIYQDMIQTDASINPGNSGGPLVNSQGEVIGVNAFIFTGDTSPQSGSIGIGFAIPINKVKKVVEELKKIAETDRSYWTGLEVYEIDRSLAFRLGLSVSEGVLIWNVASGSPASKAGLNRGDIITEVNDEQVKTVDDVKKYITAADPRPGREIEFSILRDSRLYKASLVLERRRR